MSSSGRYDERAMRGSESSAPSASTASAVPVRISWATEAEALSTATKSPTINIVASELSFTIFPSSPIAK